MYFKNEQFQKAMGVAFSLIVTTGSLASLPAIGAPRVELQNPAPHTSSRPYQQAGSQNDILLVMANKGTTKDDTKEAFEECHGTVIGTMGSGDMEVLILQTEKGKLLETEKKLSKNKKFGLIQRNHRYSASWVPNDPEFTNQWHMSTINANKAWGNMISSPAVYCAGSQIGIAVFDSGCNSATTELNGYYKCNKGYDAKDPNVLKNSGKGKYGADSDLYNAGASTDAFGHGTEVATTAAAHGNNGHFGTGVAPSAHIYPIHITGSDGKGDDLAIVGGILQLMKMNQDWTFGKLGVGKKVTNDNDTEHSDLLKAVTPLITPKIINISYDVMPDFEKNELLQKYFKKFHDVYGGIIFVSAGNNNVALTAPRYDYLNVVSAIDKDLKKAWFSNYGKCVTVTAPGTDIICTNHLGKKVSVNGTSFAAPQAAAVAAIMWGFNFNLPNTRIEALLKSTAVKPPVGVSTDDYGDGLIDAEAAVKAARRG